MARERRCACEVCFYCDAALPARHEHDHFPVPAALAGTETVPACMNCHELKDRTPLEHWPLNFYGDGLAEVLATAGIGCVPGTTPADILVALGDPAHHWPGWSCAARLVYGKLTNLAAAAEVRTHVEHARHLYASGVTDPRALAVAAGLAERIVRAQVVPAAPPRGGRPKVMDARTVARARALLQGGGSSTQVARHLGVSRATLYRSVNPWPTGAPRRVGGRPPVMDADKLAAARARAARGESPTEIAKALGVSRATVYRHLAEEPAPADG